MTDARLSLKAKMGYLETQYLNKKLWLYIVKREKLRKLLQKANTETLGKETR